MKVVDKTLVSELVWESKEWLDGKEVVYTSQAEGVGLFTILDRINHYGNHTITTSFQDIGGYLWQAKVDWDIRQHGGLTLGEAIDTIKLNNK